MGREALVENGEVLLEWGQITYRLKRSRRRRTVGLKLDPDQGLVVYCPQSVSRRRLEEVLHRNSKWIREKSRQADARRAAMPKVRWVPGAFLPFQGVLYPLELVFRGKKRELRLIAGRLRLMLPAKVPAGLSEEELRAQMHLSFRAAARETIEARVAFFESAAGVLHRGLRIKGQKTRWGSCSARGFLNFNWRLILAPPPVLDYVVVHELCHLAHLNHSPRFWERVAAVLPAYKQERAWLTEHGPALYAY